MNTDQPDSMIATADAGPRPVVPDRSPAPPRLLPHALAIAAVYLATRCLALTRLPLFNDEAIYIYWGKLIARSLGFLFAAHSDGKPPLHSWLLALVVDRLNDPLAAGRLVSVGAGALGLAGTALAAGALLRSRRAAVVAAWLYVLLPFCVFYDRLALPDTLLAAFGAWALYASVLLARSPGLKPALLLGAAVGLGRLTKSPAILFLAMAPAALLLEDPLGGSRTAAVPEPAPDRPTDPKADEKPLSAFRFSLSAFRFSLFALASAAAWGINAIQTRSPDYPRLAEMGRHFAAGPAELLRAPFAYLPRNLPTVGGTLLHYLTLPLLLLAGVGLGLALRRRAAAVAAVWAMVPLLAAAAATKLPRQVLFDNTPGEIILFPRYLLIAVPGLILLITAAVEWGRERVPARAGTFLVAACVLPALAVDGMILFRPAAAPLPIEDRAQHVEGWPAGQGVREMAALVSAEARGGTVDVYTEGTFGILPMGLGIYLPAGSGVRLIGAWPLRELPPGALAASRERPVFVVLNRTHEAPAQWPVRLVARYPRPGGSGMSLWRVIGK